MTIVGWGYLGGSLGMHAEYRLLVSTDEPAQWTIYRRYSVFERFFKKLVQFLGENRLNQWGIVFPAKNYFGSRVNAMGEMVGTRMIELQAFLDKITQVEDLNHDNQLVYDFVDYRGRGMSGIVKGSSK